MKKLPQLIVLMLLVTAVQQTKAQDLDISAWKNLTGYWKFQDANHLTKATVGNDLVLSGTHKIVEGAFYGDTAVRIGIGSYYRAYHNIQPNGGGKLVNNYTLMFDFKVADFKKWHTFFQTDTTNANDGEGFIRPVTETNPGRIGTATTKYTTDSIYPNTWYRLVISVSLGKHYRYYLNGNLVLDGNSQDLDGRFALQNNILFFADNDQEDDSIDVASLAIFDTSLSSAEIGKIGTIDPCIAKPPVVNLGNDTFICDNSSLTINAGSFARYVWSNSSTSQYATFDAKNLKPGKNSIWIRVTDVNGCMDLDTISITLYSAPVVSLGADRTVCEGTAVTIAATGNSNSSYSYVWKEINSGTIISHQNIASITSSGTYAAIVNTNEGCVASDTIEIRVNPAPQKPIVSIFGPGDICNGDTVRLQAPAGFTYNWSNGETTENIYISTSQQIRLQLKNTNGCLSEWSDTIKINVNPVPNKPVLSAAGNVTFCEGDSVILNTAAGFNDYLWNDGPGSSTRVIKQAGTYNVFVKNASGCLSEASNSITVTVSPLPQKPALSISGDVHICEGENIEISGPAGFDEYLWSNGGKTQTITANASGSYSLQVKNADGCFSAYSNATNVYVHALPEKPVIQIAANNVGSSVSAAKYFWYNNGNLLPGSDKNLVNPQKGYYRLQVFNDTCYSEISDSVYFENLGISPHKSAPGQLLLFPNPANSTVLLQLPQSAAATGSASIVITDMQGKRIKAFTCTFAEVSAGKSIDLQNLRSGIYFIQLSISQGLYYGRLQKM